MSSYIMFIKGHSSDISHYTAFFQEINCVSLQNPNVVFGRTAQYKKCAVFTAHFFQHVKKAPSRLPWRGAVSVAD